MLFREGTCALPIAPRRAAHCACGCSRWLSTTTKPAHSICSYAGPSARSACTFAVMVASPEYTCAAGKLRYAKSPAKSLIYQTVDEVPDKANTCARQLHDKSDAANHERLRADAVAHVQRVHC